MDTYDSREAPGKVTTRGALWWLWCLCLVAFAAMGCSSAPKDEGESTGAVSSALAATLSSITLSAVPAGVPRDVTFTIKATGTYSDGTAKPLKNGVQWMSSNVTGASVDAAGVVTVIAQNGGPTTITVRDTATGKTASVLFAITLATVTSINVTPAMKTVPVGTQQLYTATAVFSDASKYPLIPGALTWSSSNVAVATVGVSGNATAVAPGVSVISVRHLRSNATDATTLIAGNITLASLAVSPGASNIPNTTIKPFSALATYSDGSIVNVTSVATWRSSKATVATISVAGIATAVGDGFTTITASFGGLAATGNLTVGPITLKSIALTPPTPSIPLGAPTRLVATGTFIDKSTHDVSEQVTWSSNNTNVVTVSNALGERGKVTAVGLGTARVKVIDPTTAVTAFVPVVVTAAELSSLTINPPQVVVPAGLTQACQAFGHYTDGAVRDLTTTVTWTIVGPPGVSISNALGSEGLLSAATVGASRFVQATDPTTTLSAQAPVTVTPAVQTGLEVTPASASISVGRTQPFVATAVFSDGTKLARPDVAWTSSNGGVVTVSNAPAPDGGTATGVALGSAVIRTSDNGFTASADVTVTVPTVTSVTVQPAFPGNGSTPVGRSFLFRAIVRFSDGTVDATSNDVTWSTSDPAIATVSNAAGSRGLLTGAGVGPVVLTAVDRASGVVGTRSWNISAAILISAELSPANVSVPAGRNAAVSAVGHYSDGTTLDITQLGVWSTDDPTIATVTTGLPGPQTVHGNAVGVTGIVMQGPFNPGGSIEVTAAVLDALTVSGAATMTAGDFASFTADGTFSDGTHVPVTAQVLWSSSNPGVASVSNAVGHEGEVIAIGAGTATITARDGATGLSSALVVTVSAREPTIAAGHSHSCALFPSGRVRCWGLNDHGQLGLGDRRARGSALGDMGGALPEVSLGTGRKAVAIAAGYYHTCALLDDGRVKCWGVNAEHELGAGGDTTDLGDQPGEMGDALPAVELGAGLKATQIAAGALHTCALLSDATVKCWGLGGSLGVTGTGDVLTRGGPGTMGDALPRVALGSGRSAKAITAGALHTCALLDDDTLKCWGDNRNGALGLGDTRDRGASPTDMGDALPVVALGSGRHVRGVTGSGFSTCAILDDGGVKCWGYNGAGVLGLGDLVDRGSAPLQMGDSLPAVSLGQGRTATLLGKGHLHVCARLDDGQLKCWGWGSVGQLGNGSQQSPGSFPGEMGDALLPTDVGLGRTVRSLAGGFGHTCAVLDDATVKCWGLNDNGQLGLGDVLTRGAAPGQMGDALPVVDLSLALDLSGDAANCGAPGHSCLGGACAVGVCQPIALVANQLRPGELSLFGGTLTWNAHGDGNGNGGGIYRASVDGSALTSIATGLSTTSSVAVDVSSTAWTDSLGIHILPSAGGAAITLVPTADDVTQIAMDASDLYFTSFGAKQVLRVARDGVSAPVVVADMQDAPFGITLDTSNVYFTGLFAGDVKAVSKAGGAPTLLATGRGASQVVLRNGYAYWVGDGGLKRVPLAGGATEVLANDPAIQLSAIGVDADTVFFPTFDAPSGVGTIQALPLNGGIPRVLVSGQSLITEGLQSDGAALYYTDAYGGRVMKVAK